MFAMMLFAVVSSVSAHKRMQTLSSFVLVSTSSSQHFDQCETDYCYAENVAPVEYASTSGARFAPPDKSASISSSEKSSRPYVAGMT